MAQIGKTVLVALVSLLLLIPGFTTAWAQPLGILSGNQQNTQQKTLSSESGRYVFGQISSSGKDKFMLDTFTGRLWKVSESGKMGVFLTTVSYRMPDGEYSPTPDGNNNRGQKEPKGK